LNGTFFLEHLPAPRTSQAVRSFVILRRALSWQPRPANLTKHVGLALRNLDAIARTVYRESTSSHGPVAIQLKAMAEQAPNPASRLTLGNRRNAIGLRRPRLDWQLTDHDRASMIRTEALIGEELQRAGIGRLVDPLTSPDVTWQISGQWHHLGTTRMHVDPTQGVVDVDGRVHDMSNLWVTGGSVFPTGGYANPTLTIVALALRLADHLTGNTHSDDRDSSGSLLS
jgi:choline dehydrogenase-like flavoprotein